MGNRMDIREYRNNRAAVVRYDLSTFGSGRGWPTMKVGV